MTELSKIAQKYYTDKGSTFYNSHCYTEIYDQYFQKFKNENRKIYILEIGIQYGYDLLMINEYFEGNCEIYAFDIDLSQIKIEIPDNIHVFEINATDLNSIIQFYNSNCATPSLYSIPVFDIIIDDGSHESLDILHTLNIFYDKLAHNGIYIIEDLHYKNANDALYFLNFMTTDLNIDLSNLINNINTCVIYHIHNSYCIDYNTSICGILTFKH